MKTAIDYEDTNSIDTFQSFTSIDDDRDSINSSSPSPAKNRSGIVTGRGITLGMLMADGIVESGDDLLTIDYLVSVMPSCNAIVKYLRYSPPPPKDGRLLVLWYTHIWLVNQEH